MLQEHVGEPVDALSERRVRHQDGRGARAHAGERCFGVRPGIVRLMNDGVGEKAADAEERG
jgi:hypothetical protein